MTDTAARRLFEFVDDLNEQFSKSKVVNALAKVEGPKEFAELVMVLTDLTAQTKDEILRANFKRTDHTQTLLDRVTTIHRTVLNNIGIRGTGAIGPVLTESQMTILQSIAEQIEIAGVETPPASRQDMIRETDALIAEVKEWELEEYAKKTLLIQLNHIQRIVQASDLYSESDLRKQVKSIISDFAIEFEEMDKAHQSMLERLARWAKRGFFPAATMLALAADTTAVAGLLTSQ